MKKYIHAGTNARRIQEPEDVKISRHIQRDYNLDFDTVQFLGTFEDHRGRRAYKYRLVMDYHDDPEIPAEQEIIWVAPPQKSSDYYYNSGNQFSEVAFRWGKNKRIPRRPKNPPVSKWPNTKTITKQGTDKAENDTFEFDIIRSKDAAIAFLFEVLSYTEFPMMMSRYYYADDEEYEEAMINFDTDANLDSDSHTWFSTSDGRSFSINDEIDLESAIDIYYAIPQVEDLHHTDSHSTLLFNGHIWKCDDGYWYGEAGRWDNPDKRYGEGNWVNV